jgi:MFS family permease
MLDAFSVMLYALVLTSLIRDFSLTRTVAGLLGALTLVGSGFGGVLFGMLADRYGRRPALALAILTYSIFTASCALAQSVGQLAVLRFLVGLGMGGAWTAGAVLVSETWIDKHRGKAVAFMQSFWAVGYSVAAVVVAFVLPRAGWRGVFLVGAIPIALAVWVLAALDESPVWQKGRAVGRSGSLREIFRRDYLGTTLTLTLLSTFTLFAYWGLNLWVPAYLSLPVAQGGVGLGTTMATQIIVLMQTGLWLGYVSFGYVSDAIGRRKTFVGYLVTAAVLVLLYSSTREPMLVLALSPFVAFFGAGYFSGFGAVTAEIYPTSIRATAQGFTFNVGRIGSAVAPFVVGSLAETRGFGVAFLVTAVALLLAAMTWLWLPETRGRSLA